jgi:hypothetical protein
VIIGPDSSVFSFFGDDSRTADGVVVYGGFGSRRRAVPKIERAGGSMLEDSRWIRETEPGKGER